MERPMRVALIGFGAIGKQLARSLLEHRDRVEIVAVLTSNLCAGLEAAKDELEPLRHCLTDQLQHCLERDPELVVECAGHAAVDAYAQLAQKNNTMIVPGNMTEVSALIATAMALIKKT